MSKTERMHRKYTPTIVGDKKVCCFCGRLLPLSDFYKNGVDDTGRQIYRDDCKTCYSIRRRENAAKKRHSDFIGSSKRRGEANVEYTHQQWKEAVIYFNGTCAYCGCTMRKNEHLTKDHLIPISKGGTTTQDNIVPACSRCNSSKKDSEWHDWFMKQPFFSQERMNKIFRWRAIIKAAEGDE